MCITLHVAHLLSFYVPKSQSGGSPATIQLTVILAQAVPDKERNLRLAWGARLRITFLLVLFEDCHCWFLSPQLSPFLPHISCIYKYFVTLLSFTKHAACLFFSSLFIIGFVSFLGEEGNDGLCNWVHAGSPKEEYLWSEICISSIPLIEE